MQNKFSNKQACIEYLRNSIIAAVDPYVQVSDLRLAVRDSEKTHSKYINLYFSERWFNEDRFRLPYIVRISDHANSNTFSRRGPHSSFRVYPVITEPYRVLWDLYEKLTLKLQTCQDETEKEAVKRHMDTVDMQIQQEEKKLVYAYDGELEKTIKEMIQVLKAHPVKHKMYHFKTEYNERHY